MGYKYKLTKAFTSILFTYYSTLSVTSDVVYIYIYREREREIERERERAYDDGDSETAPTLVQQNPSFVELQIQFEFLFFSVTKKLTILSIQL